MNVITKEIMSLASYDLVKRVYNSSSAVGGIEITIDLTTLESYDASLVNRSTLIAKIDEELEETILEFAGKDGSSTLVYGIHLTCSFEHTIQLSLFRVENEVLELIKESNQSINKTDLRVKLN